MNNKVNFNNNQRNQQDNVVYRTKTIYECEPEWKIKLKVISETNEKQFNSHKEYVKYIDEETKKIAEAQELTLKKKTKEYYKRKNQEKA